MSTSMFGWVRAALLGSVVAGMAACGSSGTTDATSTGGTVCTPGKQEECACPGGTKGVQTCTADGRGLNACECGGSTSSGSGGAGGASGSTGTMGPMCGDGVQQAGECDPTSEGHIYCAKDCDGTTASSSASTGAGGSCAGHVFYAGMVPSVTSVWASGGLTGLKAGNDMCQNANLGADHVCDYEEVLSAEKGGELANVAAGTTAWVQRTTPAIVNGVTSAPGPGGRCNDWKYNTNHISDGEYATFDMVGQIKYHLDNDTIFDGANPGVHTIPGDLECNGATRNVMCCYTSCN
jgi:hypothetical protein